MLGKKREARKNAKQDTNDRSSEKLKSELTLPVLESPTYTASLQSGIMSAQALSGMYNVGVMVFDPDLVLVERNAAIHSMLDLDDEDCALGQTLEACIKDIGKHSISAVDARRAQDDAFYKLILKQIERGRGFKNANLVMRDERHVEFRMHRSEAGYLSLACRDVSTREITRAFLDVGSRLLSSGYWTYSFATGKTQFSDYVRSRLSEKDLEKVKANGLFGLVHKADLASLMGPWTHAIQTGAPFDATYRIITDQDGEMWQRTVGEVQCDAAGNKIRFTGFVTDITEDVKLREDLTGAQDIARSKNEFVARMSHEIKTPLNAIVGMADAISQDEMSDELRECVVHISAAAEDLNAILSDAIEHAKLSQGDITLRRDKVNVHDIVRSLKTKWLPACRAKQLKLLTKIDEAVPQIIVTDAKRLSSNLDSLISNAIKFTAQGTIKLIVAAKARKDGSRDVVFAVRDTGCGMDKDTLDTIFVPLGNNSKTRERSVGGIGLGMANTKARIEAMGGDITVKSAPGAGTTFIMTLPLSETLADESPAPVKFDEPMAIKPDAFDKNDDTEPDLSRLSVLCVEDNPANQAVIRKMIGSDVRTLIFAQDGSVALECMTIVRFDAIFMDIHMPVMDGIQATGKIRSSGQAWAGTPIIAMTADPNYTQSQLCRNIGMNDIIAKPFKRSDMVEKLAALASGETVDTSPASAVKKRA